MKKDYADLHLRPNLGNHEHASQMINKASTLGYHLIATTFPPHSRDEDIQWIRNMCIETKIDIASRIDLKPRTSKELLRDLRRFRRKFEVIAVSCESKKVARQAAKDRRVDLLNFPMLDFRKRFFDRAEAELASKSLASLEVNINPILNLEGPARIRLFSNLRRETSIAQDFEVPIVVSSGTSNLSLMRKPQEMAALAFLFDLNETLAIESVSKNPISIVKRNREKLGANFVAPGIKIIRREKDC